MTQLNWKRIAAGIGTVGAAVGVWAALRWGNHFLEQFENTTHDELAHGSFVTTSAGWRIHYTVQGEGEPVLLIHGFMDSLHTWRRNAQALATRHRVYAIDVLGFGSSDRVRDPIYTLKQQARFLDEFFRVLHIERADIVGHSMGGALALQYAYDFPASVHKLVLIAPATFLYDALPRNAFPPILRPVSRGVLGIYEKLQGDSPNAVRIAYGDAGRVTADAIELRTRMMHVRGMHDALIAMSQSKPEADVPRGLPQVNVPTLIVWGKRDRVVPQRDAHKHMRSLPNARLEWIGTAGHLPHEEEPETVNELITNFLDE